MNEILAASAHPVSCTTSPNSSPPVPVPVVAGLPVWGVKDCGGHLSYTRAVLDAGKQVMVAPHAIIEAVQAPRSCRAWRSAAEHLVATVAAARRGDYATAEKVLGRALEFRTDAGHPRAPGVDVGHEAARAGAAWGPAGRCAGFAAGRAG